jgi:hypothetical protein
MLHSKTPEGVALRKFAITIVFISKDKKPRVPSRQVIDGFARSI